MAGGDKSEGKHSWRLTPWPSGPKSKRSKRWMSAKQSPTDNRSQPTDSSSEPYPNVTSSHIQFPADSSTSLRETLMMSPSAPEGTHSDSIRLLPVPRTPADHATKTSFLDLDGTGPASPNTEPSSNTRSRDTRSGLQTRFREELDPEEKESLADKYSRPPVDCYAAHDPRQSSSSGLAWAFWILSIFSTVGSGLWLITAFFQPRWGRWISSGGNLSPSTASLIIALIAKLIETSFVAVFVASVGQILTKRAFDRKSRGLTLAEISMRNWVIQPGLMITDGPAVRHAAFTVLGIICLVATLVGMLYTTASDALVSPKLKFGRQEQRTLQSYVTASYSNLPFIRESCLIPIGEDMDASSNDACLAVTLSGASYHNFQTFMSVWHDTPPKYTLADGSVMANRPPATSILFDNITMTAAWIEAEYSEPDWNFQRFNRVVNNVTLAMPHPGVYLAATDPINDILQPNDLSGVGEYEIRASAVSPTVNVLCANIEENELRPLIYTTWPNANNTETFVQGQNVGWPGWMSDVPVFSDDEWLNRTVVDDIFRWGPKYGRRPPVFSMYPLDFNLINNASVYMSDSMYILGKSNRTSDYTLCEMRSWLSPKCSTQFNISGTAGAHMRAHCEDPLDEVSYLRSVPDAPTNSTSKDWRNLADEWNLALYMNSGLSNSNASRDRILTQLILTEPELSNNLPSLAEGLAVLISSTLVSGSLHSPLHHGWNPPTTTVPAPGVKQNFNALMRTQEYTSSYNNDWQAVFYVVLVMVFILNLLCFVNFAFSLKGRPLTDYTDPPNLFALAVNSPPSEKLKGSCGGGPRDRQLTIPFGVGFFESANHYYFEEREQVKKGGRKKLYKGQGSSSSSKTNMLKKRDNRESAAASSSDFCGSPVSEMTSTDDIEKGGNEMDPESSPGFGRSYARLSSSRSWL